MIRNNLFNLMNQLVQESKSAWRIKNEYMKEAVGNDDTMTFWKELEKAKEDQITKLQALIKKSGVKFHLHQFRHTFACKLAEMNVNAFNVQKMLGHSSILMTMKYVRSMKTEDMGEDINKISI